MKIRHLHHTMMKWAVVSTIILLSACSETPEPTPPPTTNPPVSGGPGTDPTDETPILERIEGKWLIGEVSLNANARIHPLKEGRTTSRTKSPIMPFAGIADRKMEEQIQAFLEILPDSSYLLFDSGGNFFRGKVELTGGDVLNLKGFGIIEDFSFSEGKFTFLLKQEDASGISIDATKVAPYELDERTKLLSKNWYVLKSSDNENCDVYECLLGEEIYEYDRWGNIIGSKGILEHHVLVFTASGTAYWYAVIDGKVHFEDEPFEWKWTSVSGTGITTSYGTSSDGDEIIELTEERLEIVDSDDGSYTIIFKAGPPYFED